MGEGGGYRSFRGVDVDVAEGLDGVLGLLLELVGALQHLFALANRPIIDAIRIVKR